MADNVLITAGSGTSIAADDVSSVYYQKIKLDVGAEDLKEWLTELMLREARQRLGVDA